MFIPDTNKSRPGLKTLIVSNSSITSCSHWGYIFTEILLTYNIINLYSQVCVYIQYTFSFILRATYDVLPSPKNLHQWYGEDPTCALCPTPATLKHILTGCKTITQGRYTWRHNQVLKSLAAVLESKRNTINSLPMRASTSITALSTFVREGQKRPNHPPLQSEVGQLTRARDWKMLVDIGQQLVFPAEIAATTLRPDLVLWSPSLKSVYITELTVPWENSVEEAYERKKLRYTELAADAQQRGWKAKVYPVEVGCRGFVASSTIKQRPRYPRTGLAAHSQITLWSGWKKQPVDLDEEEGILAGLIDQQHDPSFPPLISTTPLENPGQSPPGGGRTGYAVSYRPDSGNRTPLPCIVPWAALHNLWLGMGHKRGHDQPVAGHHRWGCLVIKAETPRDSLEHYWRCVPKLTSLSHPNHEVQLPCHSQLQG